MWIQQLTERPLFCSVRCNANICIENTQSSATPRYSDLLHACCAWDCACFGLGRRTLYLPHEIHSSQPWCKSPLSCVQRKLSLHNQAVYRQFSAHLLQKSCSLSRQISTLKLRCALCSIQSCAPFTPKITVLFTRSVPDCEYNSGGKWDAES